MTDFLFLGSKITADGICSHKIKRCLLLGSWASLVAQLVKNLLAMQETWVQCLGWEDPLEKEMATQNLLMKVKEESEKVGLNSTFKKLRLWHLVPSLHGKQKGENWK